MATKTTLKFDKPKFAKAVSQKLLLSVAESAPVNPKFDKILQAQRDAVLQKAVTEYSGLVRAIEQTLMNPLMRNFAKEGGMERNIRVNGNSFNIKGIQEGEQWKPLNKRYRNSAPPNVSYWRKTGKLYRVFRIMANSMPLDKRREYGKKQLRYMPAKGKQLARVVMVINYPAFGVPEIDRLIRTAFVTGKEQHLRAMGKGQLKAERNLASARMRLAEYRRPWVSQLSSKVGRAFIKSLKDV